MKSITWEDFRKKYRKRRLAELSQKAAIDAESRLDIAERILQPQTLRDVARRRSLVRLQQALLDGEESRFNRPRSPFTADAYVRAVLAALNWAVKQEMLPYVPHFRRLKIEPRKCAWPRIEKGGRR